MHKDFRIIPIYFWNIGDIYVYFNRQNNKRHEKFNRFHLKWTDFTIIWKWRAFYNPPNLFNKDINQTTNIMINLIDEFKKEFKSLNPKEWDDDGESFLTIPFAPGDYVTILFGRDNYVRIEARYWPEWSSTPKQKKLFSGEAVEVGLRVAIDSIYYRERIGEFRSLFRNNSD